MVTWSSLSMYAPAAMLTAIFFSCAIMRSIPLTCVIHPPTGGGGSQSTVRSGSKAWYFASQFCCGFGDQIILSGTEKASPLGLYQFPPKVWVMPPFPSPTYQPRKLRERANRMDG
ncbi:hypothetical protein QBC41DRAFT_310279, partial [Cercophora samala]